MSQEKNTTITLYQLHTKSHRSLSSCITGTLKMMAHIVQSAKQRRRLSQLHILATVNFRRGQEQIQAHVARKFDRELTFSISVPHAH